MRTLWVGLRVLGVAALLAAGCRSTDPDLKPPPHPEEFNVPPETDERFSRPVTYPDDPNMKPKHKVPGATPSMTDPSRFRNSGMGGMQGF